MRLSVARLAGLALSALVACPARGAESLSLHLRSRVQPFKGSDEWQQLNFEQDFPCRETAIVICDIWDQHWCASASQRCDALARKMAPVLAAARARGIQIIHAPSECMDFYKDTPQRKRIQAVAAVEPPTPLSLPDPPLPVDDSKGGCDDEKPVAPYKAWSREHPALSIGPDDVISDRGTEIYSFLRRHGIKNLLVMGVHTNMCVLNRSFAIKQMTRWGIRCILVRDLTDSMYDPRTRPFVSHEAGTELIIGHIEKYWCPTVLSADLLTKPK
jgi:nicotinamidase-related amidase